ncbi:hypothetical protein [Paenibacillus camerounensis]|uniref:hypothetical protein n=1 Tax=Paenibacillus camerounensis TaxID=1243663 RepID=UPI0005A7B199|nr:hypothetical protein [Paenibacillus camerounensis]
MIMSLLFIVLSGAMGAGIWYLIIGIAFSVGTGNVFTVTRYDALVFYIALLLLCIIVCILFAWHLLEEKLGLLLLVCTGTALLTFFLTAWLPL